MKVQDPSLIDEQTLAIAIKAEDVDRQDGLEFSWDAIEFTADYFKFELNFINPTQVSSTEGKKDQMQIKVVNSKYLVQPEDALEPKRIAPGTT